MTTQSAFALVSDFTYTVTYRQVTNGQKVETRRDISYREYEVLRGQKDPKVDTIVKTRRCFVWANQYFQIDIYHHPRPGLSLVEAYMPLDNTTNDLPPFLKIDREVTKESEFSMFNLSQKGASHVSKKQKISSNEDQEGGHHHHHHHHHHYHHKDGSEQADGVDGNNNGSNHDSKQQTSD